MRPRLMIAAMTLLSGICYGTVISDAGQPGSAKEALQELQDYIGGWKGNGTSDRDKTAIWKETMAWSWRFKGNDSWLVLEIADSKFFKSGELRYLGDKKLYQLTVVDKNGKALVFQGDLKKNYLTLERVDPATKETQQLKVNTAGGGDRLVLTYAAMPASRKVFTKEWQIGMTREGVQFGAGKQTPECIITGGLGTITVSYMGATYYVCCSGCRDAFKENPEKYIKEWKEKKKGGASRPDVPAGHAGPRMGQDRLHQQRERDQHFRARATATSL